MSEVIDFCKTHGACSGGNETTQNDGGMIMEAKHTKGPWHIKENYDNMINEEQMELETREA